jgi:hypothetical protein
MIRKILSAGAIVLVFAAPAWAQDQCVAPAAPEIPDGAKATSAQIVAAQTAIKSYAAASDTYQACLAREIARQKDQAKQTNVEFDAQIQAAIEVKAAAQRKDVQRIATMWGATVDAFNAAQQRNQRKAPSSNAAGGGGYGGGYGGGNRY